MLVLSLLLGLYVHVCYAGSPDLQGSTPIRRISIIGERHSGTFYVKRLLTTNTESLYNFDDHFSMSGHPEFGSKHCWAYPQPASLGGSKEFPDQMIPSYGDALAIVVVRNPFDWSISMHKNCWCSEIAQREVLAKLPFEKFMSTDLKDTCVKLWRNDTISSQQPQQLLPVEETCGHPLACRAAKLRTFLNIKNWAPNVEIVRHEDLLSKSQVKLWLSSLVSKYKLQMRDTADMSLISKYKDQINTDFDPSSLLHSSPWFNRDLIASNATLMSMVRLVNQYLDIQVESLVGYQAIIFDQIPEARALKHANERASRKARPYKGTDHNDHLLNGLVSKVQKRTHK